MIEICPAQPKRERANRYVPSSPAPFSWPSRFDRAPAAWRERYVGADIGSISPQRPGRTLSP